MVEKRRTFESNVHTLQKMSLQTPPVKEQADLTLPENLQPDESPVSMARVALSRDLLLRLIHRLKVA